MLALDWLSRLLRGRLDLRCSYGEPWRIDQGPGEVGEIPYHALVGGSGVLEDPAACGYEDFYDDPRGERFSCATLEEDGPI
jgi:hypothetical protein